MFLDKLWLRIKGGILVLREDLTRNDEPREKTAGLLKKLGRLINRTASATDSTLDIESGLKGADRTIEGATGTRLKTSGDRDEAEETPQRSRPDPERVLDDSSPLRDVKKGGPCGPEGPPPNPRTLG